MASIAVSNLRKYYTIYKREPGLLGLAKSLFVRKYEKVKAVDGVSFTIDEGELIGFIGPNGAGKTTTLKCLSGLLHPTKGEISVLGFNPYKRNSRFLKNISLVMGQKNQLWWDLPAIDSFNLNRQIYEISDVDFRKVLDNLSSILKVEDLLGVAVKKLSLGERMKMELIASLLHSPKVLFLDEPTIGLDIIMQKSLREFIKTYNKNYKSTIILTSHYMGDVEELCKRVIVINRGKILYDGLLSQLIEKYAPYKIISAVLQKPIDPKKLKELGDIKEFSYPRLVLKVPREKSGQMAAKILSLSAEDFNIEDPDIETVIEEVFGGTA